MRTPSSDRAATLLAAVCANCFGIARHCAQNEHVVFTNKLSITTQNFVHKLTHIQGIEEQSESGDRQYRPANRTARKAAKAAKQEQLQEQEQVRQVLESAELQSQLEVLEAANLQLEKQLAKSRRNKKKAATASNRKQVLRFRQATRTNRK